MFPLSFDLETFKAVTKSLKQDMASGDIRRPVRTEDIVPYLRPLFMGGIDQQLEVSDDEHAVRVAKRFSERLNSYSESQLKLSNFQQALSQSVVGMPFDGLAALLEPWRGKEWKQAPWEYDFRKLFANPRISSPMSLVPGIVVYHDFPKELLDYQFLSTWKPVWDASNHYSEASRAFFPPALPIASFGQGALEYQLHKSWEVEDGRVHHDLPLSNGTAVMLVRRLDNKKLMGFCKWSWWGLFHEIGGLDFSAVVYSKELWPGVAFDIRPSNPAIQIPRASDFKFSKDDVKRELRSYLTTIYAKDETWAD